MESENTFYSANILTVKVSDTGYQGGDAGHGCKVTLHLKDEGGTCMYVNGMRADDVTIEMRGDTERETFLQALVFAVESIKLQRV
jgi:hypothetical protein